MRKKILITAILCISFLFTITGCKKEASKGSADRSDAVPTEDASAAPTENTTDDLPEELKQGAQETGNADELKERNAAVLETIKDQIHVISAEAFDTTITDIKANITSYAGQIFQLEGVYTKSNDVSYITGASKDPESGLILLNLHIAVEDGQRIRVTGIPNAKEINGESYIVLESIVTEPLE